MGSQVEMVAGCGAASLILLQLLIAVSCFGLEDASMDRTGVVTLSETELTASNTTAVKVPKMTEAESVKQAVSDTEKKFGGAAQTLAKQETELSSKSKVAALDQVKADLKDLKSKVKDDKAGLKAAKQVLNQAKKSGSQNKIKEASQRFHKQRKEFAQDVKKIKRQEAGISKLQKVLGVSAKKPPPVLSVCDKSFEETTSKCYQSAEKRVKAGDIIGTILAQDKVKTRRSKAELIKERSQIKKLAAECKEKAEKARTECKKIQAKLERQKQEEASIRSKMKETAVAVASAEAVKKVSQKHMAQVKKLLNQKKEEVNPITGLFLYDNAVFYVNSQGVKSLVQFPTVDCQKATAGIDPHTFDDAKSDNYYLDEKASNLACEGPAYSNVEDPSVYCHCECLGINDDRKQGGKCSVWTENKEPWCFVNHRCAHPNVADKYEDSPQKSLPPNTAILHGCVNK